MIYRVYAILGIVLFLFVRASVADATSLKAPIPTTYPTPPSIEYVLPYPGLLPTHPLYFIKSFRDNIIEMLITDPVSKAEFYVLQADKKLNMGISLHDMHKKNDADSAFSDALASRKKAVDILVSRFATEHPMPGHLRDKLFFSIDKHREVLLSVGKNIDAITELRVKADTGL